MVRKGGIAFNKQFLLFSQCFLPYLVLIFHFKCTLKGCLQFVSIWDQSKISSSGNGLSIDRKKTLECLILEVFQENIFSYSKGVRAFS